MDTKKVFDGLLVLQYRSGNKKALTLLVNRYHNKLCRHSYWYTHDFETSKDIVQDSWNIIINKIGTIRDPNTFGSWAMRIVTRKTLDFLKKNTYQREKLKNLHLESEEHSEADKSAEIRALQKAIRMLPKNQQMVLRLFYTEDYSIKEIASILQISLGTVKSRLFHARERLKIILKP